MKAIILAAGKGTRMGKYAEGIPKGMLLLGGKTLIERQIETLRKVGIEEIIVVTGYKHDAIKYSNIKYYHNQNYASTNMIESLICAREEMNDDILVAYSDIIYTPKLAKRMMEESADISVAVDPEWRQYWLMRYGTTEVDLETLRISDGVIIELGEPVYSSRGIDSRYVGLNKFSKETIGEVLKFYDSKKAGKEKWKKSGNRFSNGYMTDFLNELIEYGIRVVPVVADRQWLEFDTKQDCEMVMDQLKVGALGKIFELELEPC